METITIIVLIVVVVAVMLVVVPPVRNLLKRRRDTQRVKETVRNEQGKFAFLIDQDFTVKETNFYRLNPELNDGQPSVLGNVLHCQTGCDSGLCGTGIACPTCPVRMILTNSFKLHRDFEKVTATMRLYDKDHQVKEQEVSVDGKFIYLGYVPHFIVEVSK